MRPPPGSVSLSLVPGTLLLLVLMAACKPWTIRPIEEQAAAGGTAMGGDASDFVTSIWDAKVVPAVMAGAVDLAPVLKTRPPSTNLLVKATATVVGLDTRSRVGLAHLDLLPPDGQVDAALQIGPVLRGTALRDALDFVRFGDFVNQIAFAGVASALNERARRAALQNVTPESLQGRTVSFSGAVHIDARQNGLLEIVPVVLTLEERAR